MPRRSWFVAFAAAGVAAAVACGSPRLPAPAFTGHPTNALVAVSYPPPPARVELIPEKPREGAVWIDGEWVWQSGRWSWLTGRWVIPPPGARYAPWTSVRDRLGGLYVAAGAWRDRSGAEVAPPPAIAAGRARPTSIVSPEGDEAPVGSTIRGDAGSSEGKDASQREADEALRALDAAVPLDVGPPETGDAGTMDGGP